ncbi:MAG: sodium:solute symporter family protein [Verrucomicrobiaceae bacterium]|nr:sodium:solute symporter family protein [Verrucomicrobiaceae bacterium]
MNALPFGTGAMIFIAIYLLSMVWIGWLGRQAREENSMRDHFIGGSGVGFLVLLLTLYATQYSGNTILGFSGKASRVGFSWLASVHFMTAIVVTYLILAPKLFTLAKKHVFITPTDFLAHRFQHRGLNLLATLIMVAALLNFYLAQLTAMGRAVEGLTTLPPDVAFAWGVAVLAAIMLLYETLGGFRAVAWTDVIQGGILAVGFFVLLALIFIEYGSLEVTTRKLAEIAPAKVLPPKAAEARSWLSYVFLLGVGAALYPQAIQRIYAARSAKALRRSMAVMAFMPLTTALIAVLAGVTAAAHLGGQLSGASTDAVLGVMMRQVQEHSAFGHGLVVLIFAAVLGAIMSTADSCLLSLSSMITKDLYAGFVRPDASQEKLTSLGKWISTIIVLSLASLAIYMNNSGVKFTLVELLEMKFDLLLQIAPAFLIGIHWKGLKAGPVFAGMAAGLVFAISFFWVDDKSGTFMATLKTSGFHPGIWALGLNMVIGVGGSLVMKGRQAA